MRAAGPLLAVLVLAGCLQGVPATLDPASVPLPDPADWAARALAHGKGHDHHDPAHHVGLSTSNFEVLGWDPLVTDHFGRTGGGHLCGDAAGDGERRLAAVNGYGTEMSTVIADVTDPLAPKKVGELVLPLASARDVALTPDSRWLVAGTSGARAPSVLDARADVPAAMTFRDACGRETALVPPNPVGYPSSVVLVDLADPSAPKVVDSFPMPVMGTHSVYATEVDGKTIVLASVLHLAQPLTYFAFFTVEDGKLVFQSLYDSVPVSAEPPIANYHNDGWVHKHPVTGQVIAYLADWDGGLVLLDVTDLKTPKEIARWSDYDADAGFDDTGSVHSALVMDELWGERHYTFVGQEILDHPRDTPTGVTYVFDTTDPARPVPVAAWTLPADVEWEEPVQFSTHYATILDRTLFVTMYHGGVWAVDVSDPEEPRSVGVFLPANESPDPPPHHDMAYSWAPTVLEAEALPGGDVVVWDSSSGVYVVRFHADRPAPEVEEWYVPA